MMKLNQMELDSIIKDLHRTLSGNFSSSPLQKYDIDLDNPIHINMKVDQDFPLKHFSGSEDYDNHHTWY